MGHFCGYMVNVFVTKLQQVLSRYGRVIIVGTKRLLILSFFCVFFCFSSLSALTLLLSNTKGIQLVESTAIVIHK